MIRLNTLLSSTALLLAAAITNGAAVAQDSGPSVAIDGYVELEHLSGDFDSETFLHGDLDLGFMLPGGGFGVDLGLQAIINDGDDFSAIYAAATYMMGPHKFSIGVPRSAYDSLNNMPAVGGIRTLDFSFGELNGGITELLYLVDAIDAPYGLRYDGEFGNLTVAASAHWLEDEGVDGDSQALAFSYQLPNSFSILGDVELISGNTNDIMTSRIGAEADFGQYKGGLSYFNRDFDTAPHIDGTESWISYLPSDRITVTGTALNTNVFDIYGLSLQYDWPAGDSLPGGAYAQIGAADGRSTDTVYDISIGFEF